MKKNTRFLPFILFFLCLPGFSQQWIWDTMITNPAESDVVLEKGEGRTIFQFYKNDSVLQKLDENGSQMWQITYPGGVELRALAWSPDSSFYVLGNFDQPVLLGGVNLTPKGSASAFVAKYSHSGAPLWVKSLTSILAANDIAADGKNVVITGQAMDTLVFDSIQIAKAPSADLFVLRLTNYGGLVQAKTASVVGSSNASYYETLGKEVEIDKDGNVILLAGWLGESVFDTTTILQFGWDGSFPGPVILKLDSVLGLQWFYTFQDDEGWGLRINSQNEIFAISHDTWKYSSRSLIVRISSAGQLLPFFNYTQYLKGPGHGNGYYKLHDLRIDSCDNIYFTGWRERWYHSGFPERRSFLVTGQISAAGNLTWHRQDSSYKRRSGEQIIALAPNRCIVAGYFFDTLLLKGTLVASGNTPPGNRANFYATILAQVAAPVNATAAKHMTLCAGSTTTLMASSAGNISWYGDAVTTAVLGQGPSYVTPTLAAGIHTFFAQASSCQLVTLRAPITVTAEALPAMHISDGQICKGDTFKIQPSGVVSYTVYKSSVLVTPSVTTTFTIIGASHAGCTASAVCQVSVLPEPVVYIHSSDDQMCVGEAAILKCNGLVTYTWSNGMQTPVISISPTSPGIYTVSGSDANGCAGTATIMQNVSECVGLKEHQVSIHIGPNPASEVLHVQTPAPGWISIYFPTGQLAERREVKAGDNIVQCAALSRGCYFVKIETSQGNYSGKLILN